MSSKTKLWSFFQKLELIKPLFMSKNNGQVYYAVGRGKKVGIYSSWSECKDQTEGVVNAKFRKFYNLKDAEEFVNFWSNYSSPTKESVKSSNLMEAEGDVDTISEDEKNCEIQSTRVLEPTHHYQSSSCTYLQPLCPHLTSEGRTQQKNFDVLALTLRIEAFEKRFDALLKEIGAITSDISHLKTEIKELKEYSSPSSLSGSFYSPKKDKDGMLQTTLDFGSEIQKTPHRSRCTGKSNSPFKNSEKTTLKRKLSNSDTSENFKRFAEGSQEFDDLISKIKPEAVDHASFTVDEDDFVEVYTDGAAQFNGCSNAKAGIGVWFGDKHPMNVAEGVIGRPTNNVAEIQAARVAIELAIKAGITKLKIFTDSEFLINCATKWINRWKRNGWTLSKGGPVKNRKDLELLDEAASKINVRWKKVRGHAGIRGNETADQLANEGILKYNL